MLVESVRRWTGKTMLLRAGPSTEDLWVASWCQITLGVRVAGEMPLGAPNPAAALRSGPRSFDLRVRCHCGDVAHTVPIEDPSPLLRCHCARCRRFHASAFATLLPVKHSAFARLETESIGTYVSRCDGMEITLRRVFCARCKSVLGAVPEGGSTGAYLAMGSVEDTSIPGDIAFAWRVCFKDRPLREAAPWWWTEVPLGGGTSGRASVLRGGCACGACRFEASTDELFQTQHCYCNLCRRLSGSAAQTWVPVRRHTFTWTSQASLQLLRTTAHGQRHSCEVCGTTMTILYDSQPDCIWPAAGACDDDAMSDLPGSLCRSVHICCKWMQDWYSLPQDGLPRLPWAG